MTLFRTHIVVNAKDAEIIERIQLPKRKLLLQPEPTGRYWETLDGKGLATLAQFTSSHLDYIALKELLVEAASESQAGDLLSIISAGCLLASPSPTSGLKVHLIEFNDKHDERYRNQPYNRFYDRPEDLGFGCQVAERVVKDEHLIYALEKLNLSLDLHSFTPHSASPTYGQVFDHFDEEHNVQTRCAFAIEIAFSGIEELQLEIRSSQKKPRFTDPYKGVWNEAVLDDINKRLRNSNVSSDMTFNWIYRGEVTEVEKAFKPYFGVDAEWVSSHKSVRDKTLTFPEALHNFSYLRNFISSHRFNSLTKYISPYDIFNSQMLLRELLLRRLKLWERMLHRHLIE